MQKAYLQKTFCLSLLAVTIFGFSNLFAKESSMKCPTLTAKEVRTIIYQGNIRTNPEYTLADEAGKTPEEVVADEPTANPYDTYYSMAAVKKAHDFRYYVYVGNVLAKDKDEARFRAEKIVLGSEQVFQGKPMNDIACAYKTVHASPEIPGYPFKSKYESVALIAADANKIPKQMMHSAFKD